MGDVSIVVLSYNRRDVLEHNLRVLLDLVDNHDCELIVVDNASSDGSQAMIAAAIGDRNHARLIANDANLGVAGGRNTGWRAARRDFILNIDDDTLVTDDLIGVLLATMLAEPKWGVISPRVLHAATRAPQHDHGNRGCETANFHGACHLVRGTFVKQVGLNDELCSFGGEELDLSIRIRAAGLAVGYVPEATALHDNLQGRNQSDATSRRRRWLYNFVRVHHKHFPLRHAWLFSARYFVSHFMSGLRAHGLIFAATLIGPVVRGVRDGRRQHHPVPDNVVRFYRDPDLRPDFGNVPLHRKVAGRFRRSKTHGAPAPQHGDG